MNEPFKRPDPDELLAQLKSEEQQQHRGHLKVFLGYVAGVGKTYAMLEAAHQRKEEGVDVVVAYVETHGRKETEALVNGLEVIPRRKVEYHNAVLMDMDLDAVLTRHPQLALVDELAHSNAPGLRHPKRFQDVEELLDAGIDVYTTINIQHLESLNDVVQQITGVLVRETVPNSLIDEANEIELVDLPTDELLERLRGGKVYVPDQAKRALEKFFRKGNLTALRELSLRQAADRVDSQMVDYMHARAIPGPWPASERIMVCISSHPLGERLIRTGRRLADDLNADWYVVFVETPGHINMPEANRQRVQKNLLLANSLGARVVNLQGPSVAEVVLDFAHEHNITKIVAGRPLRSRWREIVQGSVIDQIIRDSGKIDVYVVSGEIEPAKKITRATLHFHNSVRKYFLSLLLVILVTLLGLPLRNFLAPPNLVMLFLAAVVISAVFLGRGPSILASIVSVLVFDYVFVDPRLSFAVSDTQYLVTFAGLLVVGLVISNSAAMLRNQLDLLKNRNRQAQALAELSRDLNGAYGRGEVIDVVVHNIHELFNQDVVVLLPVGDHLVVEASSAGFKLDENEMAVAGWAFKNARTAGQGTDTLPAASIYFLPLRTVRGVIGILGVKPIEAQKRLTLEQCDQLESFSNVGALAIERAIFASQASESEMLRRTEKLQTALLNSISHELRTPLASITGVLTSLRESESGEQSAKLDETTRIELIDSATDQARQLNRLVENLLDMTRLESGMLLLHREPVDFHDLTGSVLAQIPDRIEGHPIRIEIPEDLPLVSMDAVLVAQVLINLVDNATKYSPKGSPIVVSARIETLQDRNHLPETIANDQSLSKKTAYLVVSVRDYGPGIPSEDLERVFEKFYRSKHHLGQVVGTGLGLSICKGIIEAHGGKIYVSNNIDQGATFIFILPTI